MLMGQCCVVTSLMRFVLGAVCEAVLMKCHTVCHTQFTLLTRSDRKNSSVELGWPLWIVFLLRCPVACIPDGWRLIDVSECDSRR